MDFYPLPWWSVRLRNMYFVLRTVRNYDQAARRKHYRKIAIEKDRLETLGLDREHIRLVCRFLSNPRDEARMHRIKAHEKRMNLAAIEAKKAIHRVGVITPNNHAQEAKTPV